MPFGIYVHIPYCLQRCSYCDFATFEVSKMPPLSDYLALLEQEIRQRSSLFHRQNTLNTLYFGGGTPSLLSPSEIVSIIRAIEKQGFYLDSNYEMTIEINPATIDHDKLRGFLEAGINRFSVGAQTFNDSLLKSVGRLHDSAQTKETLNLLSSRGVDFSFDLLFALPGQTVESLARDIDLALAFRPGHISPYCLTVPEGHPLNQNRPSEENQILMFDIIRDRLVAAGYIQYEISNFALPGKESRHNSLYWNDDPYWGVGLSAHSYLVRDDEPRHIRFWNPPSLDSYRKSVFENHSPLEKSECSEHPEVHERLTDFCHTSLRRAKGLDLPIVRAKFGDHNAQLVIDKLSALAERELVGTDAAGERAFLTKSGVLLSNQIFLELTFLAADLADQD